MTRDQKATRDLQRQLPVQRAPGNRTRASGIPSLAWLRGLQQGILDAHKHLKKTHPTAAQELKQHFIQYF